MKLGQSISRNSLLLGVFALATTVVIASLYLGTRDRIADQRRLAEQRALLEIVPAERHDNVMLDDTLAVDASSEGLALRSAKQIYRARQGDKVVAAILPVLAPDGYSGDIEFIVGVNRDGSVAGVRTLVHRETPGLGDKVDLNKSDWVLTFNGRSLDNPEAGGWAVTRDGGVFDTFTGATITPRAGVSAVRRALVYARDHYREIFDDGAADAALETGDG
jgi:electron transport complex protein RnfG